MYNDYTKYPEEKPPEWMHILPNNDLEEHEETKDCKCEPRLDFENELIIHNAFDGRQLIEQAERGELPE